MHLKKKIVFVLIAIVTIAILASSVWLWYERNNDTPNAPDASTSISDENIERLESALNSNDMETQAEALAPEMRVSYLEQDTSSTPNDVTIQLHPDTFEAGEADGAIIDATASDGTEFVLMLARIEDEWLIFNTVRK